MPYIAQKDRQVLFPIIEKLKDQMVSLCRFREDVFGYSRYAALKVIKQCTFRAAQQYMKKEGYRYWSIVAMTGVTMNIAQELHDRVIRKFHKLNGNKSIEFDYHPMKWRSEQESPSGIDKALIEMGAGSALLTFPRDVSKLDELDELLTDLGNKISFLTAPKEENPDGYDYDMAFAGFLNYSFTELVPAVCVGYSMKIQRSTSLILDEDEEIVRFWLAINNELYATVARPYEDEQIKKSGDVIIYKKLLSTYAADYD